MNDTPTPETDALCKADVYDGIRLIAHAQELEMERDRLKAELAACLQYTNNKTNCVSDSPKNETQPVCPHCGTVTLALTTWKTEQVVGCDCLCHKKVITSKPTKKRKR